MKQFSKKAYSAARKAGVDKDKAKAIAKGTFNSSDADDGADDEDLEKAEKDLGHMEPDGDEDVKKGEAMLADAVEMVKKGVGRVMKTEEYDRLMAQAEQEGRERADLAASFERTGAAVNALTKGLVDTRIPNLEKGQAGIALTLKGVLELLAPLRPFLESAKESAELIKGMKADLDNLRKGESDKQGAGIAKGESDKLGVPVTAPKAQQSGSVVPSPLDGQPTDDKVTVGSFMEITKNALDGLKKGEKDLDDLKKLENRVAMDAILNARLEVQSGLPAKDGLKSIQHLLPVQK